MQYMSWLRPVLVEGLDHHLVQHHFQKQRQETNAEHGVKEN